MPSVWVILVLAGVRMAVPLVGTIRHLVLERARRATLRTAAQAVPEGGVLVEERSDGSTIAVYAGRATADRRLRHRRRGGRR
jgi:hypothetical protein